MVKRKVHYRTSKSGPCYTVQGAKKPHKMKYSSDMKEVTCKVCINYYGGWLLNDAPDA